LVLITLTSSLNLEGLRWKFFELTDYQLHNLRVDVPGANSLDPKTSTLGIPEAPVLGDLHTLRFRLVNVAPIELEVSYIAKAANKD
jgi:hypothetical protein